MCDNMVCVASEATMVMVQCGGINRRGERVLCGACVVVNEQHTLHSDLLLCLESATRCKYYGFIVSYDDVYKLFDDIIGLLDVKLAQAMKDSIVTAVLAGHNSTTEAIDAHV